MRTLINLAVSTKEQTGALGYKIFHKLGEFPNLYMFIGCSHNVLSGLLSFSGVLIKDFYQQRNISCKEKR